MTEKEIEFMAYLSHELRTPLHGIYHILEEMMQKGTQQEKDSARKAWELTEYTIKILNDAGKSAQLEKGNVQLTVRAVSKEELMNFAETLIRPLASEKQIFLSLEGGEWKYEYLYLDGERLKQILTNILVNAIKYTPKGGKIHFLTEMREIEVNRVLMTFVIEDTGVGMEEEFLKKMFLPFTQETSEKTEHGLGLGLFLVKEFLTCMEGKIDVKSKKGIGTKVTVSMETDASEEYYETVKAEETDKTELCVWKGKKALIAEDDELNMEVTAKILKNMGIAVDKTYNGEEVTEIYSQSEKKEYDFILMDMRMPIKDGVEATREIITL